MSKHELEQEYSIKSGMLASYRSLVESHGWGVFKKIMEEQRTSRLIMVGQSPLTSFSGVMPQEFMKGEANGIGLALTFPENQIAVIQSDLERLKVAIDMENGNAETSGSTDGGSNGIILDRVDNLDFHGE